MKDITVLIDADDVLWDLLGPWCAWLNEKHGTNVRAEDIEDWDISLYFPSLSREEIFAPSLEEDFWKTVQPKEGAVEYVRKLIDDGFKVYICTASDYQSIKIKFDWVFKRYFDYILWSNVIVAQDKGMVKGDILVDDGVHNLEAFSGRKVLMAAPHNRSYNAETGEMTRANTWKEVYEIVHAFATETTEE